MFRTKILPCFLPIIFLIQIIGGAGFVVTNPQQNQTVEVLQGDFSPSKDLLLPASTGAGGEEILLSNIIQNGNMEEQDAAGGPADISYWGSTYQYIDPTYQADVYAGSYACYMAGMGTEQGPANTQNYRYLTDIPERAYIDQKINLDFYYKLVANPDLTIGGSVYFFVRVYTISASYHLVYYLSENTFSHINNSNYVYIDMRGSIGSWINFNRNITYDFEDGFGAATDPYVVQLYFFVYSPTNPTGFVEFIIDEVSVTNSTAFNFLSNNGDFEAGSGYLWSSSKYGPGSAFITTADHTEGTSALNMTAFAYYDNSIAYENVITYFYVGDDPPRGYYATAPGDFVISFDWKYSDTTSGGGNQNAFLQLQLQNTSTLVYIYYYIGEISDIIPPYNYTSPSYCEYYLGVTNFGSRDVWNKETIDLYPVLSMLGLNDLSILYAYFGIYAGFNLGDRVTLLIDDFKIVTYPLGDPSFEQDYYWSTSNPIVSWGENKNYLFVNLTSAAHTGNHALNISSYSSQGYVYVDRNCWLPVNESLYTDFWWKIDSISDLNTFTTYEIILNGGYTLNYVLGKSQSMALTNISIAAYYFVENFNQTGVWNNLVRNIYDDAVAAFGVNDYSITNVRAACFASGAGIKAETLFDDVNFVYDTTGPEVTNIWFEHTPVYYQDTMINVQLEDALSDVDAVTIYYWDTVDWFVTGTVNLGGGHFRGAIPMDDYGAQYNFYINATDEFGYYTVGTMHYFGVGDDIDPEATITSPTDLAEVSGTVTITVDCSDDGSGIDKVEFWIDSSYEYTDSAGPSYSYEWDTTTLNNGYHYIDVYTYDNADRWVQDYITVDVQNEEPTTTLPTTPPTTSPTPSPSPTDTGPLFGGIICFIGVSISALLIATILRKKRSDKIA